MVARDVVEEAGGDVLLVNLVPGQSTTGLVRRSIGIFGYGNSSRVKVSQRDGRVGRSRA